MCASKAETLLNRAKLRRVCALMGIEKIFPQSVSFSDYNQAGFLSPAACFAKSFGFRLTPPPERTEGRPMRSERVRDACARTDFRKEFAASQRAN